MKTGACLTLVFFCVALLCWRSRVQPKDGQTRNTPTSLTPCRWRLRICSV